MSDNNAIGSVAPTPGAAVASTQETAAFVAAISSKRGIAAVYEGLARQGVTMERPK